MLDTVIFKAYILSQNILRHMYSYLFIKFNNIFKTNQVSNLNLKQLLQLSAFFRQQDAWDRINSGFVIYITEN